MKKYVVRPIIYFAAVSSREMLRKPYLRRKLQQVQSPKITPDRNRNESETRRPTARMHRDEKVTRVTKVGSDFPTTNDP